MRRAIVLNYHRICERRIDTTCYFSRGTAVEPAVFERQLQWFARRFQFATLSAALAQLASGAAGPDLCVLTFDDGYQDVLAAAAAAKQFSAPLVVFPMAGHLAGSSDAHYVDTYYALLHSATRRTDISLAAVGVAGTGFAPGLDEINWWIVGPIKEALHRDVPAEQKARLTRLAEVLECQVAPDLPARLYLNRADLKLLHREGHEIGGHGVRHRRLVNLGNNDLFAELAGSRELLRALGVRQPLILAYPDGSYDDRVAKAAKIAGFTTACTIESGWCVAATPRCSLPRLLMPNALPTDQDWPSMLVE